jgi:hypothetical protein
MASTVLQGCCRVVPIQHIVCGRCNYNGGNRPLWLLIQLFRNCLGQPKRVISMIGAVDEYFCETQG